MKFLELFFAGSVREYRDLDGDGRLEIILSVKCLLELASCNAGTAHLAAVVGWDGKKYSDRTAAYPEAIEPYADEARRDLQRYLLGASEQVYEWSVKDSCMDYYVNAVACGRKRDATRWLQDNVPDYAFSWLKANEETMLEVVETLPVYIYNSSE